MTEFNYTILAECCSTTDGPLHEPHRQDEISKEQILPGLAGQVGAIRQAPSCTSSAEIEKAQSLDLLGKSLNVLRREVFASELRIAGLGQSTNLCIADVPRRLLHELTPPHLDV